MYNKEKKFLATYWTEETSAQFPSLYTTQKK